MAATPEGFAIDTSRKYATNAGKCDNCGYSKTWEFRVENKKTGKMMPGHVTNDGFKIGNGECPYWLLAKEKRPAKPAAPLTPADVGAPGATPQPPATQAASVTVSPFFDHPSATAFCSTALPSETTRPAAASFPTAQEVFNLSPDDKRMIENVKRAIVQSIRDDLGEIVAILREIRDGKTRGQLQSDFAGHAPDPTSGHR